MLPRHRWSAWRASNHGHLLREVNKLPEESAVLDLGAGRSFFRDTINTRFATFISVDFLPFDLIDLVANISGELPFKDGSFDAVISSNVFEHMPDPELAIAECYRILKPGGVLVAHTPFLMELHDEPYDFTRFTEYSLQRLLKKRGFTDIRIEQLSTFTDAHAHIARAYFMEALKSAQALKGLKKIVAVLVVRGARKLHSVSVMMFGRLGVKPHSSRHPKGYGTAAKKPR